MTRRSFILDKGGNQQFRTYVYVSQEGVYRIEQTQVMADKLLIDNQAITANEIRLTQGWHSLCAEYLNTTKTNYKKCSSPL